MCILPLPYYIYLYIMSKLLYSSILSVESRITEVFGYGSPG